MKKLKSERLIEQNKRDCNDINLLSTPVYDKIKLNKLEEFFGKD